MRVVFLVCFLILAIAVSFRDWYKGLCLAIPILAVLERRDIPRGLFNIDGLNPYNILLVFVLIAFIFQKDRIVAAPIINPSIKRLLAVYFILFFTAFIRLLFDYDDLQDFYGAKNLAVPSMLDLTKDEFINRIKWVIPAYLIVQGCNTPERIKLCLLSLLFTGVLIALQVISRMLPTLFGADDLGDRALRVLDQTIGYHRTDLGGVLAGFAWVSIALIVTTQSKLSKTGYICAFAACTLALFLTGSRAGYGAWVICGTLLIIIRWRRLILLGPPVALLVIISIPGVLDRMTAGFSEETYSNRALKDDQLGTVDEDGRDLYQITSGRIVLWEVVFREIRAAPIFGHGILGFRSRAINLQLSEQEAGTAISKVGHSHSAYLDLIVDGGYFAFSFILTLYALVLFRAHRIFASKNSQPLQIAVSGSVISLVICQLVAYTAQGTFWPHQIATFMYCSIALLLSSEQTLSIASRSLAGHSKTESKPLPLWTRTRT